MQVTVCHDANEATTQAGEHLEALIRSLGERPVLMLVSGGSALTVLDACRAVPSHATVGMLDDRFSRDASINTFAALERSAFFANAHAQHASFIDTRPSTDDTHETFTARVKREIENWRQTYTDGLTIATMGMGPDGHTAGIMPFPEDPERFALLFEDPRELVVGYDATGKNPYPLRTTVTLPFLRSVDHALAYVTGEGKRPAFARVLADDGALPETPARIMREMRDVTIFTDITFAV